MPLALMLLVFGVYLLTMSGHTYSPDEETMLEASRSLVERGTWAIHPSQAWVHTEGADGKHYSVFGPGQSFGAAPWVAAGILAGNLFPKDQAGFPLRLILSSYNALIAAGICGLLAATGMALGYSHRASLFLGGTLAFATFLWPHSRTFFAEPLVALCLLASLYLIVKDKGEGAKDKETGRPLSFILPPLSFFSGALFAAALLVKVQYAVALPAFLLYLYLSDGRRTKDEGRRTKDVNLTRYAILSRITHHASRIIAIWLTGLAAGLTPLLVYNWSLFGSPLQTGYTGDFGTLFNTPAYEGVFGLLLSPGKGLLLYAPPVLLALAGFRRFARKRSAEATLIVALAVTLVPFFGMFHFWWGGGSWGPRFLVPLLPFALLPALPILQAVGRRQKAEGSRGDTYRAPAQNPKWTAAVIALGFVVNLAGALVNFDTYINAGEDDDTRNWSPSASPILGHFDLLNQRLKLREGLLTLLKPTHTLFFKDGFSYSEGSKERGESLPRWTTGNGAIEFRPDLSKGPASVTLRLIDNRPPQAPPAELAILANDKPAAVQTAPVEGSPTGKDYTFPIETSPTRVEIRSKTWNPAESGAAPRNENIGVRLEGITVAEEGAPQQYNMVETLPVPAYYPQPRWYYNPDTKHPADLWFVYMAEMGLGRKTMLAIATPIVAISLLCIFVGVRGLRRGGT